MKINSIKVVKYSLNLIYLDLGNITTVLLTISEFHKINKVRIMSFIFILVNGLNKTGGDGKFGANGETVTVISRNNGWLTVDPDTMSRKNAYEKKLKGNLHKTSHMSPSFMHT